MAKVLIEIDRGNGWQVRQAIKDIGGTMPENLPVAEDVVKVARRLKNAIKETAKKIK